MSTTAPKNLALSGEASEPNGSQEWVDERLLAIVSDFSGLAVLENRVGSEVDRIFETAEPTPPAQNPPAQVLPAPVLPPPAPQVSKNVHPQAPENLRSAQIVRMRFELFTILSEDADFPEYHTKTILDLASKISEWTVEGELRDTGSLLLYFIETLGVFFDTEGACEKNGNAARRKSRFVAQLKSYGSESPVKFRVDFSNKPYARTVKACLNVALPFWKSLRTERDAIQLQLAKIRGRALVRKIADLEAQFDFSDLERAADLEAARKWTYRPHQKTKP